jgi:alkaline phosphatase D
MRQTFQKIKSGASYQRLLHSVNRVRGIWDDHDYGVNGGDAMYTEKKESQQLLLDFLEEPHDSARRVAPDLESMTRSIYREHSW